MKKSKIAASAFLLSTIVAGYTVTHADAATIDVERSAFATDSVTTEEELKSYLVEQLSNLETSFTVQYKGDKSEVMELVREVIYNDSFLSGVVHTYKASTRGSNVTFTLKYHTTKEQQQFVLDEVSRIVPTLIYPGMSDLEKVRAINDYIVLNTTYTTEAKTSVHSAYTLFNEGKGVCQAYALAAYHMLERAGIEAHYVTGLGNGVEHAWNLVKVDGEWYHLDVTFNDPLFETLDDTTRNYIHYKYFLMSDAQIMKDHSTHDVHTNVPKATSERFTAFHTVQNPVQVQNELYFVKETDDFSLYKLNLEDQKPVATKVLSTRVQQPFYANGAIFFSDYSNRGYLTKFDIKTGATQIIQQKLVSHIVREGDELVAYNGASVVHREKIVDDGKPTPPEATFDYIAVIEQIDALNHLTAEYIEDVNELLDFVSSLPKDQQGFISNLDVLFGHSETVAHYSEIAETITETIEQLDTDADLEALIAQVVEIRKEINEVMPSIAASIENLEALTEVEAHITEQAEAIVADLELYDKDFAVNAAQALKLIEAFGDVIDVVLPETLANELTEIKRKYDQMQNLTFDNSKAWSEPQTTKVANKSWTVTLSNELSNSSANKDKVKIVDMFGEPVQVEVTIKGNTITIKPTTSYVADIPYTLVIEKGLENTRGKQLHSGLHLQFTFKQ